MFTYARTMLALDRQGLTFAGTVLLAKGQKERTSDMASPQSAQRHFNRNWSGT
jgi:hypothetical protein